jgi:hypothetical protein
MNGVVRVAMAAIVLPAVVAVGCSSGGGGGRSWRAEEVPPPPYEGPPSGSFPNWGFPPVPDAEDVVRLDEIPLHIADAKHAGAGVTGASRVIVEIPDREGGVPFKFKPIPRGLDGWNNSPRKEIAAFAVQKLILDEEDYVVPTTWLRCIPPEVWEVSFTPEEPTIEGTNCVLVALALWLNDVRVTHTNPFRIRRWKKDGAYAYYLANLNLLTYLIDHRDGRQGNFLVSKLPGRPQFFSIDNGISFNPWIINPLVRNWHRIRVPALRRDSIERLRQLEREDLDFLAVVAQMQPDENGRLRLVLPGPPVQPSSGVWIDEQTLTVQFGLTIAEIDKLWSRIQALLERVDKGELALF